jgi:hypothetical protein
MRWGDPAAQDALQARIGAQEFDPWAVIELFRLLEYLTPVQFFTMTGDSATVFTWRDVPRWNTDAIQTLLYLKMGDRAMLALVFINPFTAEAGVYEVTINDCGGEMELLEP